MRVFRYQLPLDPPVVFGQQAHQFRTGLLLEQDGHWSEAAPLPYFSQETLDDVIASLRGNGTTPRSLEFALETLRPLKDVAIPMNALLQGSPEQIEQAAESLAQSDCRAVKLKVGRGEFKKDVEMVRFVRSTLQSNQSLRLDANRAWDWDTAMKFSLAVKDLDIEYLEEPLQDPTRLDDLTRETGIRYALDETLLEYQSLNDFALPAALIIKPTILGGRAKIVQLSQRGVPLTFSASYESGVGLSRIVQLAAEFAPDRPAGLDTYRYLKTDVLQERWTMDNWAFHVKGAVQLDKRFVEQVEL